MDERKMNLLYNGICYVLAPLILLIFLGADLKLYYLSPYIILGIGIFIFLIMFLGIYYKKKHPEYHYKINDRYTKILAILIFMEFCFSMR